MEYDQFLMVLLLFSVFFIASTSFVSAANNTNIHTTNDTIFASNSSPDTSPPVTINSNPSPNALNVPGNQHIKITYNEPIKFESSWIELRNSDGKLIPITKSISANSLTLTPTSSLNMSTTYTVSVHTNSISDLAGQWKSCYISKNAKTSIITYETAGVEYPGALEDECNLHGVTSCDM